MKESDRMEIAKIGKRITDLIHEAQFCVVSIRLDHNNAVWASIKKLVLGISELMTEFKDILGSEAADEMTSDLSVFLSLFLEAQSKRNLEYMADILESKLIPSLGDERERLSLRNDLIISYYDTNKEVLINKGYSKLVSDMEKIHKKDEIDSIGCHINRNGEPVIEYFTAQSAYWLTGTQHPFMDAVQYVYEMRDNTKVRFALGGACMVYEALAFMRINVATKIFIMEEDTELLCRVFEFFDLSDFILEGRIIIIYEDVIKNMNEFVLNQELLTKYKSMEGNVRKELKNIYAKYRVIVLSNRESAYLLHRNFYENQSVEAGYVSDINPKLNGRRVVMVAGGPSLDESIDVLQRLRKDSIIMCVGTSAKRLLDVDIDPDYVIITDPLDDMVSQLDHPFDYSKTELIFLCTAYHEAVEVFKGKKMIVYQNEYYESEEAGKEQNVHLYNTGGSVATTLLDIVLFSDPKEIICLGFDMAYTNNQLHVSGVDSIGEVPDDCENLTVKGVRGDTINTSRNLTAYRNWIENRLKRGDESIPIINISNGAFIEGMSNISCDEAKKMYLQ